MEKGRIQFLIFEEFVELVDAITSTQLLFVFFLPYRVYGEHFMTFNLNTL